MGEFNAAVTTLLEAFSSGIAIIRSLRRRRKESKSEIDSTIKAEESRLSKSLKRNRVDVRSIYKTKVERLGGRFADGDAKAHSSLTSILFRLNAGFVSIIDRFTRGESTRVDYQTLVNLSNTSRVEAIKTFKQLSARISRSSVALSTTSPKRKTHRSSKGRKAASSQSSGSSHSSPVRSLHSKSASAPGLPPKQTALGPATTQGWVRPKGQKAGRKRAIDSDSSRRKSDPHDHPKLLAAESMTLARAKEHVLSPLPSTRPGNRISILSFSSDSTKIGEIPQRRGAVVSSDSQGYLTSTVFPLAPWKRPEKPRSKFMRLFGK